MDNISSEIERWWCFNFNDAETNEEWKESMCEKYYPDKKWDVLTGKEVTNIHKMEHHTELIIKFENLTPTQKEELLDFFEKINHNKTESISRWVSYFFDKNYNYNLIIV